MQNDEVPDDETVHHSTPSTRQWLIEAAQREISEHGFSGVSMRNIASRADVDPSLVRHYFGSKQHLLLAAVQMSLDLDEVAAEVLRGRPSGIGRRIVKILLELCGRPETAARTLVGFSASLSSPEVVQLDSSTFLGPLLQRVTIAVSPDCLALRTTLVTSQMLALVIGRYLVRDPVLLGTSHQDLIRIVGRTVQHDLTGPLVGDDAEN
jgi:AcrR family transcriptional regulator